jgi:hypothetical protein
MYPPKALFYIAQKDNHILEAIYLQELTVNELLKQISSCIGMKVMSTKFWADITHMMINSFTGFQST